MGTTVACSLNKNPVVRDVPVSTTLSIEEEVMQIYNQILRAYGFPSIEVGGRSLATGLGTGTGPVLASDTGSDRYQRQLNNGASAYNFGFSTSMGMHKGGLLGFGILPSLPFFQFSTESANMSALGALAQVLSFSTKIPGGLLATIMQLVPSIGGGFLGGLLGQIMGGQGIGGGGLLQSVVTGAIVSAVTSAIRGGSGGPLGISSPSPSRAAALTSDQARLNALADKVGNFLQQYKGKLIDGVWVKIIDNDLIEAVVNLLFECDDCSPFEAPEPCSGAMAFFEEVSNHFSSCNDCKIATVEAPTEVCPGMMALCNNIDLNDINASDINETIDDDKITQIIAHIEGCNICSPTVPEDEYCSAFIDQMEEIGNHFEDCVICNQIAEPEPPGGLCGGDSCLVSDLVMGKYIEEGGDFVWVPGVLEGVIKALTQSAVDEGGDIENFLYGIRDMMQNDHETFRTAMEEEYFSGSGAGTASVNTKAASGPMNVATGGIGSAAGNFINNVVGAAGVAGIGNGQLLSSIAGGALSGLINSALPFGANIALQNILGLFNGSGLSIRDIVASMLPIPRITRNGEEFSLTVGPLAAVKLRAKRFYPSWCSKPAVGAIGAFPHRCLPRPVEAAIRATIMAGTMGGFAAYPLVMGTSAQVGALAPSLACADGLCAMIVPRTGIVPSPSEKHCLAWHLVQCRCKCVGFSSGVPILNPAGIQPFPLGPFGTNPLGCGWRATQEHFRAAVACAAAGAIPTRAGKPLQPGPCCRAENNGTMASNGATGMEIEASAVISVPGFNTEQRFAFHNVRGDFSLLEPMYSHFSTTIQSSATASGGDGDEPGMAVASLMQYLSGLDSTGSGENSCGQRLSRFITNSRDENDKPTTLIAPTSVIREKGEEYHPVDGQWLAFEDRKAGVVWSP